jgi:hypothetical protein
MTKWECSDQVTCASCGKPILRKDHPTRTDSEDEWLCRECEEIVTQMRVNGEL